jgi:hypothetical protein
MRANSVASDGCGPRFFVSFFFYDCSIIFPEEDRWTVLQSPSRPFDAGPRDEHNKPQAVMGKPADLERSGWHGHL